MEVLALLGAGAYLSSQIYGSQPVKLDKSANEEDMSMMERPRDFYLHQAREHGIIAVPAHIGAARLPWSRVPNSLLAADGGKSSPLHQLYGTYADSFELERLETMESIVSTNPVYAKKRTMPLWTAFNSDLTLPGTDPREPVRRTNVGDHFWMPPLPTDTDVREAALMGKSMPPDPLLFTPDAYYFTAPGLDFRYVH